MNKTQTVNTIKNMIENGYAETHVGYHADYRRFGNSDWNRGCYAQIAVPYGETYRVYAPSYAGLLEILTDIVEIDGSL